MTEQNISTEVDVITTAKPSDLTNRDAYVSTFPTADVAGKVRILSALNSAEPLAAYNGQVIELSGIIARPAQYRDQDKRVQTGTGVYILATTGESYFSLAGGVFDAFRDLIGEFGADSSQWPTGLAIIPNRRQLAGGRQLQTFDVTLVEQPDAK